MQELKNTPMDAAPTERLKLVKGQYEWETVPAEVAYREAAEEEARRRSVMAESYQAIQAKEVTKHLLTLTLNLNPTPTLTLGGCLPPSSRASPHGANCIGKGPAHLEDGSCTRA